MEGGDKGVACFRRDVHSSLVIQMSIFIFPILYQGSREQGGVIV